MSQLTLILVNNTISHGRGEGYELYLNDWTLADSADFTIFGSTSTASWVARARPPMRWPGR